MEDITDARTGPGNEAVCTIARVYMYNKEGGRVSQLLHYNSHIVTAAGLCDIHVTLCEI